MVDTKILYLLTFWFAVLAWIYLKTPARIMNNLVRNTHFTLTITTVIVEKMYIDGRLTDLPLTISQSFMTTVTALFLLSQVFLSAAVLVNYLRQN